MSIRARCESECRLRVPTRARAASGARVHAQVVLRVEVVRRISVVPARGLLCERAIDLYVPATCDVSRRVRRDTWRERERLRTSFV